MSGKSSRIGQDESFKQPDVSKTEQQQVGKEMGWEFVIKEQDDPKMGSAVRQSLKNTRATKREEKSRNGSMKGHKASSRRTTSKPSWRQRVSSFFSWSKKEKLPEKEKPPEPTITPKAFTWHKKINF